MKKPLAAVLILGGLFSITNVQADEINGQTTSASEGTKQKPRKFTASLLIDTSATLAPHSANSAGEEMSYSGFYRFDLGVPLSRTLTANIRGGYSQEYSYVLPDGTAGDLIDSRLGLTQTWGEIRKDFTLAVSPSLYIPTSKNSKRAGLQSALGLGVSASQKLGNFDFTLAPQVTEFFHDVITQLDGKANIQTSISLLLGIDYALSESLTLGASFQPSHSWTYFGTTRDKYLINYDLSYLVTKNLILSMGIFNNASALKSNGLDYNYVLFDQAQFMGYFDILLKL